jgi:type I restriction enzyme M protein
LTTQPSNTTIVNVARANTDNDYYEQLLSRIFDVKANVLRGRFQCEVIANYYVFSLFTQAKNIYAIVVATPSNFDSAEQQLKNLLEKIPTAGIGVIAETGTNKKRWLRRRFDRVEFEYISEYCLFGADVRIGETNWVYQHNGTSGNRQLELLSERVENGFFEIHSYFRDLDGLHFDEALDELCKILYVKLYDEEQTISGQSYKMQTRLYSNIDECAADIRMLYNEAVSYDNRVFEMKIPGYSRSRGVFATPIRLSNVALVKAVEALQSYHLGHSTFDIKGRAFQKVIAPTIRAGMGQYFTPNSIARFVSKALCPTVRDLIIDPFCGSGHFLTTCLDIVRLEHGAEGKLFHEFAFGKLHGIEKSERMVRIAMTDMRLHGDGHSNIRCADALLEFSNYPDLKPDSFDIVLSNPPFGSILTSATMKQLGFFELSSGKNNVPLEIIGLERCVQLLRPGGRMGIVLPDGIVANRNTAYVRDWLMKFVKIRAVVSLPLETFTPFGASIKTSVLILRKWEIGETKSNTYPVFLARIDNVGYDATGRSKSSSDLAEAAEAFNKFITKHGW